MVQLGLVHEGFVQLGLLHLSDCLIVQLVSHRVNLGFLVDHLSYFGSAGHLFPPAAVQLGLDHRGHVQLGLLHFSGCSVVQAVAHHALA